MAACQLSVVIPCFNGGSYVSEAVTSVLGQDSSVTTLEVIVVNDRSSDPLTLHELDRWARADHRVRVIDNTGRRGPASARNAGISAAAGEWVAFLDADDLWLPGGLEARWRVVETERDARWISADFLVAREDGSRMAEPFFKSHSLPRRLLADAYERGVVKRLPTPVREFIITPLANTNTVMVRKSLLVRLGGFEVTLDQAEDLHLWLRLAREADLFFVPAAIAVYRQHASSLTHRDLPPATWNITAYTLLLRDPAFRAYRALIRRKLAEYFEQNAYYHRRRAARGPAVRAASKAVMYAPTDLSGWKNLLAAAAGRR